MNPKFSVIIPALNGTSFLEKSLPKILESKRDDIEIVVSDNHSDDKLLDFLQSLNDYRVRAIKPPCRLNMHEHYEFALNHAEGEWIFLLGADDALLPYAFESIEDELKRYPETRLISWSRAYYFWPGVEEIYGEIRLSYLKINFTKLSNSGLHLIFGLLGLKQLFDLPQLYTCSAVHKTLISAERNTNSRFYTNCIPDIYSSVVLLKNTRNYLKISKPLSLVGSSKSSLGIANRIYEDNLNNGSQNSDILSFKTVKELHELKINSYFLLDSYYSYCQSHRIQPQVSHEFLGLLGTAIQLRNRKIHKKYQTEFKKALALTNHKNSYYLFINILHFPISFYISTTHVIAKLKRKIIQTIKPNSISIQLATSQACDSIDLAVDLILQKNKNETTKIDRGI